MKLNKIALGLALAFFVIWFGLLYAIADHPVPSGFFWIPIMVAIGAGLIYWRVPAYQQRIAEGKKGRFWLAVLEGLVAGLVLATIIVLQPTEPQPGMPPLGVGDYIGMYVVMSILGMFNTGGIHIVTSLLSRKKKE